MLKEWCSWHDFDANEETTKIFSEFIETKLTAILQCIFWVIETAPCAELSGDGQLPDAVLGAVPV